jgi:hypothetical protein
MGDVRSARRLAISFYGSIAMPCAMLDHDDGIGAAGDRCACHDLDGFARGDRSIESRTCARLSDDPRAPWHFGRPYRKAIAHRTVEGRIIAIRGNVLSKYTPRASLQRNDFRRREATLRAHLTQNAGARFQERQSRHESQCSEVCDSTVVIKDDAKEQRCGSPARYQD